MTGAEFEINELLRDRAKVQHQHKVGRCGLGQLKIDKSEINYFLDEIKRGTEMGTENWKRVLKWVLKKYTLNTLNWT